MLSWVDGQPAELLSVKDRGWLYGDGLFETIAVRPANRCCWIGIWQRFAG